MKPFRIRILAGQLNPGVGSHNYNRELAIRLGARGHQVSVICFEASPDVPAGIEQFEIPRKGYANYRLIWRYATSLERFRFGRELDRRALDPVDVVIAAEHLFLTSHARRFPRTPFVYLPHALLLSHEIESYRLAPPMHRATLGVYERVQRWALEHAAATVRFTRAACDILAADCPTRIQPRFVVIPIGVEIPDVDVDAPRTSGDLRLLYVGRLTPAKRVEIILEALARCERRNWTLDILGDGQSRDPLEHLTRSLNLTERVRFHGLREDVGAFYGQADLLLFASKSESLGLVLVEAMSYGVPCLALRADRVSTWNVNEEIIDHGRTGLLADGEAGFQTTLDAVLQDPVQLVPLGRAARANVVQNHSWDAHLDRYEALFEQLTSGRQPG